MALSMQEKQHVGREVALRYLRARKKEKGIMLQEFCATTGYSPPYAAYLCKEGDPGESGGGPPEPFGPSHPFVQDARRSSRRGVLPHETLPWHRQRKHVYGPAVVEALVWMEHLAGELCGKRLQAAIPELLRALERSGTCDQDFLSHEIALSCLLQGTDAMSPVVSSRFTEVVQHCRLFAPPCLQICLCLDHRELHSYCSLLARKTSNTL